ncbi:unnamed protein product [Vitrella brassicaformis CCMP3155]|uniref:SUEL-type lectin domain-containing protein n=1 Tax=Vitrella brassicaformis (strain CCMP3155) TaxID=1169540 RepID=A0A0G4G8S1_VITBC|nr:unnamed protein product [Vitrella brassicaformis CCMP3155]|eukprot:CEM25118.1 unnamed protein product [Vitrella brassicaformis CCMP3155]
MQLLHLAALWVQVSVSRAARFMPASTGPFALPGYDSPLQAPHQPSLVQQDSRKATVYDLFQSRLSAAHTGSAREDLEHILNSHGAVRRSVDASWTAPKCYDSLEELVISEDEYDYLHCPQMHAIKGICILDAWFGRRDNAVCVPTAVTPNCTVDVTKQLQDACDTQRRCEVFAHEDYFGSPCAGPKYLQIQYLCHCGVPEKVPPSSRPLPPLRVPGDCSVAALPPSMAARVVCDQSNDFVSCELGKSLDIYFAGYGRREANQCRPTPSFDEDACAFTDITQEVASMCNNQTICQIENPNDENMLPCEGVDKYKLILYSCICPAQPTLPPPKGDIVFPFTPNVPLQTIAPEEKVLTRRNMAANKPTVQSSTEYGDGAYLAVDGNTDVSEITGACTHTKADEGWDPWWRVDLEDDAKTPIWGVSITARKSLQGAQVWVGSDDCSFRASGSMPCIPKGGYQKTWKERGTTLVECQDLVQYGWAPPMSPTYKARYPAGKYLWVVLPGSPSKVLSLCEVEVWAFFEEEYEDAVRRQPPTLLQREAIASLMPRNIARDRPSQIEPPRPDGKGRAELCVDGNTSADPANCTESAPAAEPWLRVTLDNVEFWVGDSLAAYDDEGNSRCALEFDNPDFPPGRFTQRVPQCP